MKAEFDLTIVGGGPAGSYLAYLMARDGFKVALIDKKKSPLFWEKTCGSVTSSFLRKMMEVDVEKAVLNEFDSFAVRDINDLSHLSKVFVDLLVIDRKKLGEEVISQINDYDVKLFDETEFVEPILDTRGVRGVSAKASKGEAHKITSRITIDASGVDGVVREKIKNMLPEASFSDEDLVLAYLEFLNVPKHDFSRFQLYIGKKVAPGGYAWVTPVDEKKIIVGIGATFTQTSLAKLRENLEELKKNLGIRGEIELKGSGFLPVRRPFSSFVSDGFAMVGDSASQGNPFFGGGIEGAVDAARFAFRNIREALDKSEHVVPNVEELWTYNFEFMTKKGSLLAMVDLLRLLAQSLNDSELRLIAKNLPKTLEFDLMTLLNIGLKLSGLIFKPRFLWKTVELVKVAEKVRDIYRKYPSDPKHLDKWMGKVNKIFKKFTKTINRM